MIQYVLDVIMHIMFHAINKLLVQTHNLIKMKKAVISV